jgi:hypothetical protein
MISTAVSARFDVSTISFYVTTSCFSIVNGFMLFHLLELLSGHFTGSIDINGFV